MKSDNCKNVNRFDVASISHDKAVKKIIRWIEADELKLHKAYMNKDLESVKDLRSAINYWTNKLNQITYNHVNYNKVA